MDDLTTPAFWFGLVDKQCFENIRIILWLMGRLIKEITQSQLKIATE